MDIGLFDNYEDDGQLNMFEMGMFDEESLKPEPVQEIAQAPQENFDEEKGPDIRIRSCSSCGKFLFVREEETAFVSECNNCGVRYLQQK